VIFQFSARHVEGAITSVGRRWCKDEEIDSSTDCHARYMFYFDMKHPITPFFTIFESPFTVSDGGYNCWYIDNITMTSISFLSCHVFSWFWYSFLILVLFWYMFCHVSKVSILFLITQQSHFTCVSRSYSSIYCQWHELNARLHHR
jgi:hypothetical protein